MNNIRKSIVERALHSWIELNKVIAEMTEEECLYCIEKEKAAANRQSMVKRYWQRIRAIKVHEARNENG